MKPGSWIIVIVNYVHAMNKKRYLITDSCHWFENPKKGYNPNPKRTPHSIEVVDLDTGTIVELRSGSIIQIVKNKRV